MGTDKQSFQQDFERAFGCLFSSITELAGMGEIGRARQNQAVLQRVGREKPDEHALTRMTGALTATLGKLTDNTAQGAHDLAAFISGEQKKLATARVQTEASPYLAARSAANKAR